MTPEWAHESVTQLRKLVADGLSAGKISDQMGISRSAVAGKAHRLGIKLLGQDRMPRKVVTGPARPQGASHNDRKITQTIRAKSKPKSDGRLHQATVKNILKRAEEQAALPATEAVDLPPEVIPVDQRKTLHGLTADTCRWPIGNPDEADFHFCGGAAPGERPYCGAHSRMAYETPAQRKERLAKWHAEQKRRAAA